MSVPRNGDGHELCPLRQAGRNIVNDELLNADLIVFFLVGVRRARRLVRKIVIERNRDLMLRLSGYSGNRKNGYQRGAEKVFHR